MTTVFAMLLMFSATGDLIDSAVLGSSESMAKCAPQLQALVHEHANDLLVVKGSVVRGYCFDTKTGVIQEEVAIGEAKAGVSQHESSKHP